MTIPDTTPTKELPPGTCNACWGKGEHSVMEAAHYSPDFPGDVGYTEAPNVRMAKCSRCRGTGQATPQTSEPDTIPTKRATTWEEDYDELIWQTQFFSKKGNRPGVFGKIFELFEKRLASELALQADRVRKAMEMVEYRMVPLDGKQGYPIGFNEGRQAVIDAANKALKP